MIQILLGTIVTVFAIYFLGSPLAYSREVPRFIFTESGIYLSAKPEEQAKIGESLSLKDLGRRFASCRVIAEYSQGDEETIETEIICDHVTVSVSIDESGKIEGFWTTSTGAAFQNGIQVGDKAMEATGSTAYCNLCTEDEMPYCKPDQESNIRYDIEYDACVSQMIESRETCRGEYQIGACVLVHGLGHGPSELEF